MGMNLEKRTEKITEKLSRLFFGKNESGGFLEEELADELETIAFASPVKGDVIPVSRISDEAFASGAMGDGVGIRPAEGRVYAPFDGTAEAVFPTGHAVGLKSEEGWEVLIHIGVDTVQLNGKGFSPLIRQGEHVKKGQPLVEFDREQIAAQGYDATVIYVVTNIPDEMYLQAETGKMTDALENVMYIKSRE